MRNGNWRRRRQPLRVFAYQHRLDLFPAKPASVLEFLVIDDDIAIQRLRMAADHPLLGVGPGNWPVEYPRYTFSGDPAFDPEDFIPTNP